MSLRKTALAKYVFVFLLITADILLPSLADAQSKAKQHPWMNPGLSPDQRAAMVVREMTMDEKISLLHGTGMVGLSPMSPLAIHSNGGGGDVGGVSLLGITPRPH